MRIHAIDIVQPPGIAIPAIVAIDIDPSIVDVAATAKSNAVAHASRDDRVDAITADRTRRGGAASVCRLRYDRAARGRAMDTFPTVHRVHAHTRNTCDTRRRPRARMRS